MNEIRAEGGFPPLLMDQVFDRSYRLIDDLIIGHKRYCLLLSALESSIIDILDNDGPMEAELLLKKIGCNSEFGWLWIDALGEIGIVERTGTIVRVRPALSPYLVSDSPLYQGDSIRSAKETAWCNGVEFLKREPDTLVKSEGRMTPEFLRIVAQHSMRGELQDITKILSSMEEFRSARLLLDIGGGHGMYSISFCQQNPELSAVILDRPHITPATSEMVEKFGMTEQIRVISGDMNLDLPGSHYDIVYVSHIFYRKEDLSILIPRIVQVLNKGGLLVSNHKFGDDWKRRESDATAALENEIIRDFHQMIPEQEYLENLKSAGLGRIETWKVPANTGFSTLHTALKL